MSASSAHRWLECTASPRFEEQFSSETGTSTYAQEGTLAHTVCELHALKEFQPENMSKRKFNSRINKCKQDKLFDEEMLRCAESYVQFLKEKAMEYESMPYVATEVRVVQVQNLPRTYTEPLELARNLVKGRQLNALSIVYGRPNDTLSQLIRTAFVAKQGNVLIDADFSAIEARVISWLAGEEWRLEVFRNGGDIYCASASQMFHCVVVKGGENGHLRQKGKVAELALGYQGGPGALINMGALKMGLSEEELPDIVNRWREANSKIKALWNDFNNAAIDVIQKGGRKQVKCCTLAREYNAVQNVSCLTILLPSGRKLYYPSCNATEIAVGFKSSPSEKAGSIGYENEVAPCLSAGNHDACVITNKR